MAGASQESNSAPQSHDAQRPIDNVLKIHVHHIHSTQPKHDCVPILVDTERRFLRVIVLITNNCELRNTLFLESHIIIVCEKKVLNIDIVSSTIK